MDVDSVSGGFNWISGGSSNIGAGSGDIDHEEGWDG